MANRDTHGFPVGAALEHALRGDGPRVEVVGEHHRGADEHPVLQDRGLVHQRVVLDLAVVPYHDTRADVRTATDDAVRTQTGPLPDLGKRPDDRAVAKIGVVGHLGTAMDSHRPSTPETSDSMA